MPPQIPHGERRATIGFVGDLILARRVSERLAAGMPSENLWGDVLGEMRAADAVIGNLEGPITERGEPWRGPKLYRFRAHPRAADALATGNIRAVALANNHMLDFGAVGLDDTRRALADVGIAFAGAGANDCEARTPALFPAGGLKVGMVSLTDQKPAFRAGPGSPGTFHTPVRDDAERRTLLAALCAELAAHATDLNVLSVHWGINYGWWTPRRHRAFARAAIDAGFHLVHGHSAHLFQAVEFHGSGAILYDTGNAMNDFRYPVRIGNDRSFLFLVNAEPALARSVLMVPLKLDTAMVNRAAGSVANAIRRRMRARCRGFAVALSEHAGDLLATPPSGYGVKTRGHPHNAPIDSASSAAQSRNR